MKTYRKLIPAVLIAFCAAAAAADSGQSLATTPYAAMVIHSFGMDPADLTFPGDGPLTLGTDGNFYGATPAGGTNGTGALFRMTPQGQVIILYSFSSQAIADGSNADGASPAGGLTQGADGAFYGTARAGGTYDTGTVFRYTPGGGMTVLYHFGPPTIPGRVNLDGMHPNGGLLRGPKGSLFGTALSGGRNGGGTIWRLDPDGSQMTIHSFGAPDTTGGTEAANPTSGLIAGADGNYYGTTSIGDPGTGTPGFGTVYRLTPAGQLTVLHWFGSQYPDGHTPYGPLVADGGGTLYGTTTESDVMLAEGSAPAIFRITTDGQYTLLHIGSDQGTGSAGLNIDGLDLYSGLTRGGDGYLYGAMAGGGEFDHGSIFRVSPEGDFVTLYYFGGIDHDGNGNGVSGGVVLGPHGDLYGLTNRGGTRNMGAAYRMPLPAPAGWGSGAAVTISATIEPSTISLSQGQTATLSWTSTNAGTCHIWDGVYGHPLQTAGASGKLQVAPRKPQVYRYQIDCDADGKAADQPVAPLTVKP